MKNVTCSASIQVNDECYLGVITILPGWKWK